MEIEIKKSLFDYASLNAEARIVVQQRAGEIKSLAKRVAADIVEIGGKLAEVKDRVGGNGKFTAWLESELGWSERTGGNFIAVYQKFSSANFALENIATSALYLLAAPSTPAEAVEAAQQLADQGERVTHGTAKQLVERAKARRPRQVALVDPIGPAPVELPKGAEVERVNYIEAEIVEEEPESVSGEASPAPPPAAAGPAAVISPVAAAKPAEGPKDLLETAWPRPKAWYEERIEISISLMPHPEANGATRKVLYAVVAGERTPYYGMGVGEGVIDQMPPKVDELIQKLATALSEAPATKIGGKVKPAVKKPKAGRK